MSTQEIDFTAGTDSHPNDPTPGTVRPVAVPPAARTLGTLPHIDYEDAFLVETGPAQDRTGEQWARAILEDAPIIMRRALRWGWFALGLRLGSTRSDRFVLGWEVRAAPRTSRSLVPAPASGGRPNSSASASSRRRSSPPSCNRRTTSDARCGAGVAPARRLVVRYLLDGPAAEFVKRSETDER